ncbi:MAG: ferrous iron transport protein B [Methanosarcina sp.]
MSKKECNSGKELLKKKELLKIVLIGNPNVGKSSLFNALSGSYTIVSNYPGTSVEISRGKTSIGEKEYEIIDTPGMYSLLPVSEEERVSQRLLFDETTSVCLHVVDAKNLRRMLSFTLQLLEADLPLVLVLNMMDEAKERGIKIDIAGLSQTLGIPVVGTISSEEEGIEELKEIISDFVSQKNDRGNNQEFNQEFNQEKNQKSNQENKLKIDYGAEIEPYIAEIESWLESYEGLKISKRALALLLLQEDQTALEHLDKLNTLNEIKEDKKQAHGEYTEIHTKVRKLSNSASNSISFPLPYLFTLKRQEFVNKIIDQVMENPINEKSGKPFLEVLPEENTGKGKIKETKERSEKLKIKPEKDKERKKLIRNLRLSENIDNILIHPVLGIPVLFLILYFGLYLFVGVFAAGTVVDFLENTVFGEYINPLVTAKFISIVPSPALQDLFVGEYGIFTQAVTYAIALILPIVGAFFLVFSIIEDTGYLPRLGLLLDGIFKKIGLSGRAVIPMVLGFGCSTMGTLVTRTLETKKERVIANVLLALAIPCSAQLGIILSILSESQTALLIWAGVIILEFILIGYLASRVLPGEAPTFILEMPPLRRPRLSNIAVKTYSRMHWYFLEVLPLFVLASVLIWIGKLTGLFTLALKVMEYPTRWIGLPSDAAEIFLFGFFRRDFGAAGIYGMYDSGVLTAVQLVVAAVTLTLFMPCIAQFMMTIKERGFKTALAISGFIFPFAFFTGFVVNTLLKALGVSL